MVNFVVVVVVGLGEVPLQTDQGDEEGTHCVTGDYLRRGEKGSL